LVSDGRVRSLDKHRSRFNSSVEKLSSLDLDAFWNEAVRLIPREGQFFPRIELSGDNLVLRLREPAEFKPTVTLWTADEADERLDSTTKGPDLAYGAMLRRKSNLHGADEAVILNQDGFLCEGALSSLVWWRDDVLYGPDDSTNWLPSITRNLVFELANQAGYKTGTERATPQELLDCEVWSLSSLQGIRYVTAWDGVQLAPPRFAGSFAKRLELLAQPIS
jgi:branched-subunit amino acid aminotransferase/4-amino-4-deoxychorismate lyase